MTAPAIFVTMLLAGAAALREIGAISFPIPQWNRQTNVVWGRVFSPTVSAVLWGLDLGSVVTTRVTFSGTWIVPILAIASRHANIGATLMLFYWIGRAVQVWIPLALVRGANDVPRFLQDVHQELPTIQRVHVVTLLWAIAMLGVLVGGGKQL
jgi:hypothetical protein